jgi:hypothetical protein
MAPFYSILAKKSRGEAIIARYQRPKRRRTSLSGNINAKNWLNKVKNDLPLTKHAYDSNDR